MAQQYSTGSFEAVTVSMGFLSEEDVAYLRKKQEEFAEIGLPISIDRVAVNEGLLDISQVREIHREQGKQPVYQDAIALANLKRGTVASGSIALILFLGLKLMGFPTDHAASIAAFSAVVIQAFVEYKSRRHVHFPITKSLRVATLSILQTALYLSAPCALLYAVASSLILPVGASLRFTAGAAAVVLLQLMGTTVQSIWRRKAKHANDARNGLLRDVAQQKLALSSTTGSPDTAAALETLALDGLRKLHEMNPWDITLRGWFPKSPSHTHVTVVVFHRNGTGIVADRVIHSSEVSKQVLKAFDWFKLNHHPSPFNSDTYRIMTKVAAPSDIPRETLRDIASLAGWLMHVDCSICWNDLETCPVVDMSHLKGLSEKGMARESKWLNFKSVIAFSVDKDTVVCVLKNRRNGFSCADVEFTNLYRIMFSEILGGTLVSRPRKSVG